MEPSSAAAAAYQAIMEKYEEIVAFFEHLRDPDSATSGLDLRRIIVGLHGHLQETSLQEFLQTCEPNLQSRISFACMVHMVQCGTETLVDVTSWLEGSKRLSINM